MVISTGYQNYFGEWGGYKNVLRCFSEQPCSHRMSIGVFSSGCGSDMSKNLYVVSRFTRFIWGYYDEGIIFSLESYPYKRVHIDWTSTTHQ